jgi:ABC-2 type transport system ATP-binding protein
MLEVKGLSKRYRGLPALDNVSFRVRPGEIVGYVGPNGSGKSTTVKIVTGLLEPSEGQVLFEGHSIRDDLSGYRAAFGYVPEEAHVYTHLSGLEYLQLVGRLRNLSEALIDLKANKLLALLGLESWRHSPISLYSKGMKQRVLIAAALLHDPRLLIFDEPLSGLDVVSARLFKDLLQQLAAQGKAILYISHVLEVVELVCHRVIVIAKGKILADAPPAELKRSLQLANLESVFAQLVQQQDTQVVARELAAIVAVHHA